MDRPKLTMLVLAAQLLLVALAIAWGIHTALVARYGAVYFIEPNPLILWGEIIATALIALFGTAVFTLKALRLGEG